MQARRWKNDIRGLFTSPQKLREEIRRREYILQVANQAQRHETHIKAELGKATRNSRNAVLGKQGGIYKKVHAYATQLILKELQKAQAVAKRRHQVLEATRRQAANATRLRKELQDLRRLLAYEVQKGKALEEPRGSLRSLRPAPAAPRASSSSRPPPPAKPSKSLATNYTSTEATVQRPLRPTRASI